MKHVLMLNSGSTKQISFGPSEPDGTPPSGEEPPRGGRGHTRECLALVTDDVLRRCARPGCGRTKPDREPGKGGRPSKYCCKLCGNEASRAADSAPAAMVTHTAVSAFTAEAGQIRAALQQRDCRLPRNCPGVVPYYPGHR
ncbi:hypothetical protein [Nonomuraea wenchangensis]|uniref:hypothetical protein n=1 Tax=Nonomuraea wenchangensis TaxID=568860 RepID=UPI003324E85F